MDRSPPGSPIPGILQARTLEWVAFPSLMRESEVTPSCLTLSKLMDCSLPGSSVHGFSRPEYWSGILDYPGRINKWSEVKSLSHVWLFATPWTVAYQAPQSMEFFRQEYWSGLPFPSPGDLPDPGIEPRSPAWQADALPSEPPGKPQNQ